MPPYFRKSLNMKPWKRLELTLKMARWLVWERRSTSFICTGCLIIVIILCFTLILNGSQFGESTLSRSKRQTEHVGCFDCTKDFDQIKNLEPYDCDLLQYIKENHMYEPSSKPYNLSRPNEDPSQFKEIIKDIFGEKTGGVFIECGANDGEFLSNTLELERKYGWNGILIEANPQMIPKLLSVHRQAYIFDVCLSSSFYPEKLQFLDNKGNLDWEKGSGKMKPKSADDTPVYFNPNSYQAIGFVECFPLLSILAAIKINHIDYFSLDIEGNEFKVLSMIPFDLINIEVIQVEFWMAPEGKEKIQSFMESKSYTKVHESKSDFIFKKIH